MTNFGWPCYEGSWSDTGGANLNVCETLSDAGSARSPAPHYAYSHAGLVVPGETCRSGGSSTAGFVFYPSAGGSFPADFQGAGAVRTVSLTFQTSPSGLRLTVVSASQATPFTRTVIVGPAAPSALPRPRP